MGATPTAAVAAESTGQLDQANWREEPGAVTATTDPRTHRIRVDAGSDESKFVRVSARARHRDE
jgi:hypothetical protein